MNIPLDLLSHAVDLVSSQDSIPSDVQLRRAVSAAYYALYHHLTCRAAALIAPNVPLATQYRIGRWFEHGEMKKVCGRFAKSTLEPPLRELLGEVSPELRDIASYFMRLQQARHAADYDLSYSFSPEEAGDFVRLGIRATNAWDAIQGSAEANIFILSLLMWKNWEKGQA